MSESLEALLDSLLFEGYALYPYTSAATKNATPTPFGIVYPPAYATSLPSAFDHLELRCALRAPPGARTSAEVRFLATTGRRNQAIAHRMQLAETSVEALVADPDAAPSARQTFGETGTCRELHVSCELRVHRLGDDLYELILRVENLTPCAEGLDRAAALERSLISTHPLVRLSAGRFVSPLEHPCESVNTFPVLASDADDAVLGAAIVLPDHPRIAPESHGEMFDSTEIEEALLLHVQALSDSERREIERDDPRVREMVERAAGRTPEQIGALHGRVTLRDPVSNSPPCEPEDLPDPTRGEAEALVDGVRFRRGGKVRLRPGENADLHARLLDGRTATIERILVDYDGKPHLGVTIDGDPGQELLRETGRLLFFFAPEVEVLGE